MKPAKSREPQRDWENHSVLMKLFNPLDKNMPKDSLPLKF